MQVTPFGLVGLEELEAHHTSVCVHTMCTILLHGRFTRLLRMEFFIIDPFRGDLFGTAMFDHVVTPDRGAPRKG